MCAQPGLSKILTAYETHRAAGQGRDCVAPRLPVEAEGSLGRAFGHFIFFLIGLKRILFTNIFQKL